MKLKGFLQNFIKRKGATVGVASILEKIGGFLLVLIATRLLTTTSFGLLTYANTTLVFLIPFIGFGLHQALIRYGSISKSQSEKRNLFIFTLKKGIKYSAILTLSVVFLSPFLTLNLQGANIYLIVLSFQFISLFLFEMVRIYARLLNLNKLYAQITVVNTFFLVVIAFLLSVKFNSIGYVIALSFVPFLVALAYLKRLNLFQFKENFTLQTPFKKFLMYGVYTSLSSVLSSLLYAIDILLLGNIIKNEEIVALYKVSSILPFSILILPIIFIKTDFVLLANKSKTDKQYLKTYYVNYLKLFSLVSLGVLVVFWLFSEDLLLLFGPNYNNSLLMMVFVIGVIGALLFRVPLGNILSAIGLAKVNAVNSFIIMALNIIFSTIFIVKYGALGGAVVTAVLMWLSGIISLVFFIKFLKSK